MLYKLLYMQVSYFNFINFFKIIIFIDFIYFQQGCVEGCKCLDNYVFDESTRKCISLQQCQKSAEDALKKATENEKKWN